MSITHNQAIELYQKSDIDGAWDVAQMDDGLISGVTKEEWLDFAAKCLIRRQIEEDQMQASILLNSI